MADTRFSFGPFTLSPARRLLQRDQGHVRLIPRYFDVLLLLVQERHRVVQRQEIFDRVWPEVVVSDGALSQAIRTLRRALGDDPREPRYIRTVSRYGYQFVFPVAVIPEEAAAPATVAVTLEPGAAETTPDPPSDMDALVEQLTSDGPEEDRRDAAEQLHSLGTDAALERLTGRAGEDEARAILRDARWDVPGAGDVPLKTPGHTFRIALALVRLRLRRAARLVAARWAGASLGGAVAGMLAGAVGGVALVVASGAPTGPQVVLAVLAVGGLAGALGGAGIGAGITAAEAVARSWRALALVVCGALGGWLIGTASRLVVRAVLAGLFGHDVPAIGGGVEGLALGAAAGLGYALATRFVHGGGMAAPRGSARLIVALSTGTTCAIAGALLSALGYHLVAASMDALADQFRGSAVGLGPLAQLLGGHAPGPVSLMAISSFEGLMLGAGLATGVTWRARPAASWRRSNLA